MVGFFWEFAGSVSTPHSMLVDLHYNKLGVVSAPFLLMLDNASIPLDKIVEYERDIPSTIKPELQLLQSLKGGLTSER